MPAPITQVAANDKYTNALRVQRSRGCLAPCSYCIEGQSNRVLKGELAWEGLPIEDFAVRLSELATQGNFFINITDSSFEDPGKKGFNDLTKFCHLMIQKQINLSFKIHLRAESALKANSKKLELWKKAGIDVIVSGLESGNQEELSFFRKIASKQTNIESFNHLESPGIFCNILGFMMFSPITTLDILREKIDFLAEINRGWDFLNLTNSLLVFKGTKMHSQLVELGLARHDESGVGYVDYIFRDNEIKPIFDKFNTLKLTHSGFLKLNNLIYDCMNLESRIQNPKNYEYFHYIGEKFDKFRCKLMSKKKKLTEYYSESFLNIIDNPERKFMPNYDPDVDYNDLKNDLLELKSLADSVGYSNTLYLNTWLSNVNRFGV